MPSCIYVLFQIFLKCKNMNFNEISILNLEASPEAELQKGFPKLLRTLCIITKYLSVFKYFNVHCLNTWFDLAICVIGATGHLA